VSTQQRRAFPLRVEQGVRSEAEKAASKATAEAKKAKVPPAPRRRGRPPGRTNQSKARATLTPELTRIKTMLDAWLHLIARVVPLTYLGLEGHFGHHNALDMAQQANWHLIAQVRWEAAWYFPSTGPYAGRGPHRQYGDKVDDDHLPMSSRKETTVEGQMQTCLYQIPWLHKECPQPLNSVIIVKTNVRTHARAHVVLCSSALALASTSLVDYDGLRFPIEFNFRDAKQYWGLEDFMNVTPTGVTKAAHLSLFMVNVAYRLRAHSSPRDAAYSVLDLKADCRGYKYVEETIKLLPEKPAPILLAKILHRVAGLGRIHAAQPSFSFS
jgi:putative transposase